MGGGQSKQAVIKRDFVSGFFGFGLLGRLDKGGVVLPRIRVDSGRGQGECECGWTVGSTESRAAADPTQSNSIARSTCLHDQNHRRRRRRSARRPARSSRPSAYMHAWIVFQYIHSIRLVQIYVHGSYIYVRISFDPSFDRRSKPTRSIRTLV